MASSGDGARIHKNRLQRLRRVKTPVLQALYEAGEVVREDAKQSIRAGAVSGPGHIPSLPGQPPNADTHELDLSLDTIINQSRLSVSVVSRAPYGAYLEFGTSRVAARPYLRPALQRNRNRIVLGQVRVLNEIIRVYKGDTAFSTRSLAQYRNLGS